MNLAGSIKITKLGLLIIVVFTFATIYYATSSRTITNYFAINTKEINLRKLLISSIQAAIQGGKEVQMISKTHDFLTQSKGKTKEGANDPVTIADFNSHCVMQKGLLRIFPNLRVISEEDGSHKTCPDHKLFDLDPTVIQEMASSIPDENVDANDVTVWIDPLDATQEFTEKLFQYVTTMVCVAIKDKPVIGVIHNPFTMVTVWAWDGKSKSPNLADIKENEGIARNPNIIVSRSHAGNAKTIAEKVFGEKVEIITAAGAGYKTLQVVYNNATAYFHSTAIKKWDLCAGNAILNSVGGKMTNLNGDVINYAFDQPVLNDKGLLATLSDDHDEIIEKIKSENLVNF